ncbi:MAG: TRAP transporter small permease subunit, partial [Spirochaetales bacterium]
MKRYLQLASDMAFQLAKGILLVYISTATILAIIGVFFRAAGNALSWNEELMRWLLIGIGYIGASVALKIRSHIGIEFFLLKMEKSLRKIAIIIGYIFIVTFLIVIFWYGLRASL